jgi:hypothetical protein
VHYVKIVESVKNKIWLSEVTCCPFSSDEQLKKVSIVGWQAETAARRESCLTEARRPMAARGAQGKPIGAN